MFMAKYAGVKSLEQIRASLEHDERPLHRSLGPVSLMSLGIGCIIGAGIFVLTGKAAAS